MKYNQTKIDIHKKLNRPIESQSTTQPTTTTHITLRQQQTQ